MSAFNSMLSKSRSRNFGGTSEKYSCEPYLSGFCFIKWYLPETLDKFIAEYAAAGSNDQTPIQKPNKDYCGEMLSAACTSVTPPGQSITFINYEGTCGVQWHNPSNIVNGDSLSIKYIEFSGLPIYRIHKCWVDMIKCAHQGVSPEYTQNIDFQKENYAASLLYWTTKPDGVTIEYAAAYSGVIPEKDGQESFSADIASIDKVELDITYKIDYIWTDKWVFDEVKKLSMQKPYGGSGGTLWSKDGFMNERQTTSANSLSTST